MSILACMVFEKSLTNNSLFKVWKEQKLDKYKIKINKRRLVFNPTIQQDVINLHTKYEHSFLKGCCGICYKYALFKVKKEKKIQGSVVHTRKKPAYREKTCIPNMTIQACMVV